MRYVTDHLSCKSGGGPPSSESIQDAKSNLSDQFHWRFVQLLPYKEEYVIYFEGERKSIWPWS